MASKFIKENARHYYGKYSLEEFEDIGETDHSSERHTFVNKEHVEVFDEDAPDDELDIGVNKRSYEINQEYSSATCEDFKVNKGGDRDVDRPYNWRDRFDDILEEIIEEIDDERS